MQMQSRSFANLFFRIITLLFFLACQPGCKKEKPSSGAETEKENVPYSVYTGTYRIEPTAGDVLQLNPDGSATVKERGGKVVLSGHYIPGKYTLRLFFQSEKEPDAVFLLSTYDENGWRGRWGEDIKILYRNSRSP